MMAWGVLTALTAVAAAWDARARIIPNPLSWIALGFGAAMLLTRQWGWGHLAWAAGTWTVYDAAATRQPGSLGYGDVKWATVIMGFLGTTGFPVLLAGHLGAVVWATVAWWRQGRPGPWREAAGPWAPGAFVGVLLLGPVLAGRV